VVAAIVPGTVPYLSMLKIARPRGWLPVVLKPSPEAPLSFTSGRHVTEAGLPDGALNISS